MVMGLVHCRLRPIARFWAVRLIMTPGLLIRVHLRSTILSVLLRLRGLGGLKLRLILWITARLRVVSAIVKSLLVVDKWCRSVRLM